MKTLPLLYAATALTTTAGDATSEVCRADSEDPLCAANSNEANQQQMQQFVCKDLDENCAEWSKLSLFNTDKRPDACQVNSAYMTHHCSMSCNACDESYLGFRLSEMLAEEGSNSGSGSPFCQDYNFDCRHFAAQGECDNNPQYMNLFCEASCGLCSEDSNKFGVKQRMYKEDSTKEQSIRNQLDKTISYMYKVKRERKYKNVRHLCLNKNPDCTLWAAQGECHKNERYMKSMCAPACLSCDYLGDTSEDCPGLAQGIPLWNKAGDLNAFFENIIDNNAHDNESGEYYVQFHPKALSRPKIKSDGSDSGVDNDGPWLVLLHNFITDEEADRFIHIGHEQGFERSRKAVTSGEGRVTEGRTSSNTWCQDSCMKDPTVARVLERIAKTTNSTINHSEHLQLLRYEIGQFYVGHDDFIPYQLDLPCGARIVTLFLYLNDVEEGGGTRFPELDITVQPKRGMALLWPNVIDDDPMMEKEGRTFHEALPVGKGVKYGVNSWIHNEDFQTPWKMKCLG